LLIHLTSTASRPERTHRKPNRFEFGAEEKAVVTSKRKRAASKERAPAKKRRSVSKSPSRSKKSTKKGGSKKKKDPNAPKKALSAYMIFAQANRDKVKKENPDASFGELGKLLGKLWGKASKSDKAKYEAKANKDKERYEKEKAKYDKKRESSSEEEEESSD
jgi:structure-specific recognition protein 1